MLIIFELEEKIFLLNIMICHKMKNIKLCWIFMDFFGYRKLKQKDVSQP